MRVYEFNKSLSQRAVWANKKAVAKTKGLSAGKYKPSVSIHDKPKILEEVIDYSDKKLVKSILRKYES